MVGGNDVECYNIMDFCSIQNSLFLVESNCMCNIVVGYNFCLGMDFFLGDMYMLGFMVLGNDFSGESFNLSCIFIVQQQNFNVIDSIFVFDNFGIWDCECFIYNMNYCYDNGKGCSLNLDFDFGCYNNDSDCFQFNQYFDVDEDQLLMEVINIFDIFM